MRALLAASADPCIADCDGKLPLDVCQDEIRVAFNEELLQATAQSK